MSRIITGFPEELRHSDDMKFLEQQNCLRVVCTSSELRSVVSQYCIKISTFSDALPCFSGKCVFFYMCWLINKTVVTEAIQKHCRRIQRMPYLYRGSHSCYRESDCIDVFYFASAKYSSVNKGAHLQR